MDCSGTTLFSWIGPEVEFEAFAFAFYPVDGLEIVFPLPAFLTEFEMPRYPLGTDSGRDILLEGWNFHGIRC